MKERYERPRGAQILGLPTGFPELDQMTDGLQPGHLIVIAGEPGTGKTALALGIAEFAAMEVRKAVAAFSLELSSVQFWQRLIAFRARMNLGRVQEGFLFERDITKLTAAAAELASSGLYIDDSLGLSIQTLHEKARRLKRNFGIEALFVDDLQRLRSDNRRFQASREREFGEISIGLKMLANELAIPVVVLAQIRPQWKDFEDCGRPRLSDLKHLGSMVEYADLVALLWREEFYTETEEARRAAEGKADLIIAKQRWGPVGDISLVFRKEIARFEPRDQPAALAVNGESSIQ